ncbi:permease (plasmid) [Gemmatirosa kalamazoonensis]|uniref:Permease n=1 Tax=Gemmatirosa kalamazoonensis TaxID=861299 RepID=W0RRU8_9BACT|nr:ADOP family duplicated permease [Gemmatirosa kalamazoonensis]AHG93431.1 permease [Gemmatirosa kalamazoonensis]
MSRGRLTIRPGIRRAFHLAVRRRARVERDVREEIEHHVALTTELLVARGLAPEAARREALRRLGRADSVDDVHQRLVAAAREREARMRIREWLDDAVTDLRYALRQLRRTPGFAGAVIATFALGIGANATVFGLVDRLLLRMPAHVAAPERVYQLASRMVWHADTNMQTTFPYATFAAFRDRLAGPGRDVQRVAAVSYGVDEMPIGRGERARSARGSLVSAGYFALLGVQPALGRFFREDEDVPPVGAPVVVVSEGFWRRALGADPAAIGRELEIGQRRYAIVGVAPRGFTGVNLGSVDLWLPIASAEGLRFGGADWATTRQSTWLRVFVRLAPGATPERVGARATPVNLDAGEPRMARLGGAIVPVPLLAALHGTSAGASATAELLTGRVAALLGAVSGLVLLIACANVANLLLARALRRRGEIAVRLALGTRTSRLVRQLLAESVLLSLVGGAVALLLATWGASALRALLFGDLAWDDAPVDGRVLAFTAAATVITGLLAGIVPALQASRPALAATLVGGSGRGGVGVQRSRSRTALLALQAALAVVLLVGTGLFVRSLRNLYDLRLGMEPARTLLATMDLESLGMPPRDVDALYRRMEERVRALPGVQSAAVAWTVPGRGSWGDRAVVPGRDSVPLPPGGGTYVNAVRPGFFRAMGTHILRGRDFTDADDASSALVAIVNESLARRAWPGQDPIGKCLKLGSDTMPCRVVVGVSENSRRQDWIEEEILHVHLPLSQALRGMTGRVLVVRPAAGDPRAVAGAVRHAMQTAAPALPYADVRPLDTVFASELRPWRLGAALFGAFGVLAVLLAGVGLHGVLAFSVGQRTRELGVRMALGARRTVVVRSVVRQGLALAGLGGVAGLALALGAAHLVEPLLFRVPALDPGVFAGVAVVLLVVATAATLLPAWRATRVDPAVVLREE